ncbi:oxalate decarboxylase family bicupin [Apiospora hydei]|uniref:Oxalate decarboxylase family bicupin n=1 Tax=Apiospora hydei TaxID=1337664 RepID=A0ABR1X0P0_9PEZI
MQLASSFLVLGAALSELGLAVSVQDSPRQRLLDGHPLPANFGKNKSPHTPGFRDPLDKAVDSVGDKLDPLPYHTGLGASVLGPWNWERSRQGPDMVRPPSTDHGSMNNMRWSFADSHVRIEVKFISRVAKRLGPPTHSPTANALLQEGGWTRQTTVRELGSSVELAAVNMCLDQGVVRELHWHKEAEWAYVLDGEVRVTAIDYEGGNFMDDLKKATSGLSPNGTEFLLIFDDGSFSEESTFILSDWLAHTPKSVIAKNFDLAPEIFAHIPESEKHNFQGTNPGSINEERPTGKGVKKSKYNFTHRMLDQEPKKTSGGEVRITDSNNFEVSKTVAAAHVTIQPGAIREMHWHPNADEWSFFIKGRARITIFAAEGTARTFDYVPGDVGIVPRNNGHFVENIGDEPVEMLEVFRADEFRDFSLFQWMGETPKKLVVDHLFKDDPENGEIFWKKVQSAEKDEVTQPDVDLEEAQIRVDEL